MMTEREMDIFVGKTAKITGQSRPTVRSAIAEFTIPTAEEYSRIAEELFETITVKRWSGGSVIDWVANKICKILGLSETVRGSRRFMPGDDFQCRYTIGVDLADGHDRTVFSERARPPYRNPEFINSRREERAMSPHLIFGIVIMLIIIIGATL